jgi:hypothetical protein
MRDWPGISERIRYLCTSCLCGYAYQQQLKHSTIFHNTKLQKALTIRES